MHMSKKDEQIAPPLAPRPYMSTNDKGEVVLLASRGIDSGHIEFPPQLTCNQSLGEVEEYELPREGTLYSYTVTTLSPLRQEGTLILGYVDLMPEVRVFAQIEVDPKEVHCDMPVVLTPSEPIKAPNGAEVLAFKFKPLN